MNYKIDLIITKYLLFRAEIEAFVIYDDVKLGFSKSEITTVEII